MRKAMLTLSLIFTFLLYAAIKRFEFTPSKDTAHYNLPNIDVKQPSMDTNISSAGNMNYKDGIYTGKSVDAFYGNVKVQATVQAGKITDIQFLDYPNDRGHSIMINKIAMPQLKSEVIQAQSSNVDIVSGATATSMAFIQSLNSALFQAKK